LSDREFGSTALEKVAFVMKGGKAFKVIAAAQ
jgi:hypothetical protein